MPKKRGSRIAYIAGKIERDAAARMSESLRQIKIKLIKSLQEQGKMKGY